MENVDGVFMPTGLPTASGDAMEEAYRQIFQAIQLNVTFSVDEISVASDNVAYALTRSNGTQTILATGGESVEANREIFVLHRTADNGWKIARYMFNKTQ
jgi:ketosteroid isomerase-like protein